MSGSSRHTVGFRRDSGRRTLAARAAGRSGGSPPGPPGPLGPQSLEVVHVLSVGGFATRRPTFTMTTVRRKRDEEEENEMSNESIETGLDETELDGDLSVDDETASQVAGGFAMIDKRELKRGDISKRADFMAPPARSWLRDPGAGCSGQSQLSFPADRRRGLEPRASEPAEEL